jgi:amino acid permease
LLTLLKEEQLAHVLNLALVRVCSCCAVQVALTLADLGVLLSVVGATGSTIVSYILPGSIYYSMHSADMTWKRKAAACMFFAGCGIIPLALGFILFGGASH